jgi:predicted aldo/keto reductase-like oxidoreductase
MPCPYGLDIPGIFTFWNSAVEEGRLPDDPKAPDYRENARRFLIDYDRQIPKLRQADRCTTCGRCNPHCPQMLDIPKEIGKIAAWIDEIKNRLVQ